MYTDSLKKVLSKFFKQVHPDVTRHLGYDICDVNSKSLGEIMSFVDLVDRRSNFQLTEQKVLTFYKSVNSEPSKIEIHLPAINQFSNFDEIKRNLVEQAYPQANARGLIAPKKENPSDDQPKNRERYGRNVPNLFKKLDRMNQIFQDSLDAIIGKNNLLKNDENMLYYLVCEAKLDPRLIFFDKKLVQNAKIAALIKLSDLINSNVTISALFDSIGEENVHIPIIITQNEYTDEYDPVIKIPYNFDPIKLEEALKSSLPNIIKMHKTLIDKLI